jgi:putative DNA primase/helicase
MTAAARVLEQLRVHGCKPTRHGNEWSAKCPSHEDDKASLCIGEGANGKVLVKCQAGCDTRSIVGVLGLTMADLFEPPAAKPARGGADQIVATYPYVDENNVLLYEVVRFEPKDFRQRRPDGRGGWIWKLGDARRVPYRLPELLAAKAEGELIYIPEGEKDVESLCAWGLCATTNSGGAARDCPEMIEPLRGAHVVLLPDDDEPGRKHVDALAGALRGVAADVRVLALPGAKDITAAVEGGLTRDQFLVLTSAAVMPAPVYPLTECGNGERFAAEHGGEVRYCWERATWIAWDGKRWKPDHQGQGRDPGPLVMERAKGTARKISEGALKLDSDDPQRKRLLGWGAASEREHGLQAALSLARSIPALVAPVATLDADPFLFNVNNGTIDLRTGELRPHNKADMITKLAPVEFDPDATSELWDHFLQTTTAGDQSLIVFLQRVIGYCLTGSTREEKLFFGLGPGATGKSTIIAALKRIFGEYVAVADFETFIQRRASGGPRPELLKLVGKRLVASQEVDRGRHLAEGLIKTLVGGDAVSARDLYSRPFEFTPTFKLFLACNDPPKARAEDGAMWRRILRVPFEHVVPEADRDPDLKAKLTTPEVATAILAWGVRGCLAWQREGLQTPERVQQATLALREEMNPIAVFLEDCCLLGADYRTPAGELREAYERWAQANREDPVSPRVLAALLGSAGCTQAKSGSVRFWNGIGLIDHDDTPRPDAPRDTRDVTDHNLLARARAENLCSETSLASQPAPKSATAQPELSLESPPDTSAVPQGPQDQTRKVLRVWKAPLSAPDPLLVAWCRTHHPGAMSQIEIYQGQAHRERDQVGLEVRRENIARMWEAVSDARRDGRAPPDFSAPAWHLGEAAQAGMLPDSGSGQASDLGAAP